ncbi:MAG: hypothetical protein AAF722_06600 [Cyanobacteria bacterium P01_C01_bin.70]
MNRRLRRLRQQRRRDRWHIRGTLSPSSSNHDWHDFDATLSQLETAVQVLRQRFKQVQTLQAQQQQFDRQRQDPHLSPEALKRLQQQLHDLEVQLESQLFDWRSLHEPFWQAVRFGGLGIIIGWVLHIIASR